MKIKSIVLAGLFSLIGASLINTAFAETVTPAASVTATCKDGTLFSGKSKSGACRGHKGVATWGNTAAASTAAPVAATAAPTKAKAVATKKTKTPMAQAAGGGAGKVWVNSASKVYHCQGTKYYGTTKAGSYMSETDAKSQGYHADHGKACS